MTDVAEQMEEQHEGRELLAKRGEQKIKKNQVQVEMMRAKKKLTEEKKAYEELKDLAKARLLKDPSPRPEEQQEIMMILEELKRRKMATEDMEAKLNAAFDELSHYDLKDPNDFSEFLIAANIGLVRAKYLYHLRKSKETLPRRQEADSARCANNETALVTHDELKAWAKDPTRAIICSISHAWETREHPDPCGYQLEQAVNAVSLYEAAYEAEVWIFYDYTSLYQFERHEEEQVDSFDLSMYNMHLLYAHERTYTFRIDSLTPEDRWENMMESEDKLVKVYDPEGRTVMPKKLKDLIANRTPYEARGWCMAEIEWSSSRSRTFQHQKIDIDKDLKESRLKGRVPMSPDDFEEKMRKAQFTHRSDSSQVILLQKKVFHEKADKCEKALFQLLPEGELGKLARSLKYYKRLRALEVLEFECSEDEATLFGKALAEYLTETKTLKTLRIQGQNVDLIVKAMAEGLRQNSTLKDLNLEQTFIGPEGAKALAESLKKNSTLMNLNLAQSHIKPEGAKALAECLRENSTLTNLNLVYNGIGDEGAEALAESLKKNSTLMNLDLENNCISAEGAKALAESLKKNSTLMNLNLDSNGIGDEGAKALAESLKKNSILMNLNLKRNHISAEGAKALAESLKKNSTLMNLNLWVNNNIGAEGAKALAESLKKNSTLMNLNLAQCEIGPEGAKALAECLRENSTLTNLNLVGNEIGDEGAEALAESFKKNSTLVNMNVAHNGIGPEGAKALAESLKKNSTLTNLILAYNEIGPEGAKALVEALEQNSTLTDLDVVSKSIDSSSFEVQAILQLLRGRKMVQVPTSTQEDQEEGTYASLEAFHLAKPRIKALAQSLKKGQCARTRLSLCQNHMDVEGAKALAQALQQNSTLTGLLVQSARISDEGAKALAEALKQKSTLIMLSLSSNNIGPEGAKALAQALKQNSTLTNLNLAGNNIGDEGAKALAQALKQNSTLTHLNLRNNNISPEGAKALAQAMEQNLTLTYLCLYYKNVGDEGAKALEMIKEALERNRSKQGLKN